MLSWPDRNQTWLLVNYVAAVAVFYVASFFPQERLWGLNWYGFFGWYGPLVLLALGLVAPLIVAARDTRLAADSQVGGRTAAYVLGASLVCALALTGFVVFHGRTHFLGDGYQLLAWVEGGKHLKPWEGGAFAVQRWLYAALGGGGTADAATALRLASWGSGFLFLTATAIGSFRLFPDNSRRLLMLLGLASGGYALLFFGYFESYPLFVAAVLIFSLTGLMVAVGRLSRFWLLPALALAAVCHIFSVGLLPAAAYLLFRDTSPGRWIVRQSLRTRIGLVMALGAVAAGALLYAYYHSLFIRFVIVPFVNDRFTVEGYSMFSRKHLLDYLNLLVLLLPALPLGVLAAARADWRAARSRVEIRYLLLLTGTTLLMVFLINPGLGMPRDWDLFCFAGVPLNLLFYYLLLTESDRRPVFRAAAYLSIALGVLILAPRVASQMLPDKGLSVFDAYADLDVIRSYNGRYWVRRYFEELDDQTEATRRAIINARALPHEAWSDNAFELAAAGRREEAQDLLRRVVDYAPCDYYSWSNLGNLYAQDKEYDSALAAFQIAFALQPFNPYINDHLGQLYYTLGEWTHAEAHWKDALEVEPERYGAVLSLIELYHRQEREKERDSLLRMLEKVDSLPLNILGRLTTSAVDRKAWDEASGWLERSVQMGLDTSVARQFREKHSELRSRP